MYRGIAAAGGLCGKSGDSYEHCTHKGAPQPCVRFVTQKDGPIRIIWVEIGFNEGPNGIASHKLRLGLWTVGQRGEGYAPRTKVATFNRELVRDLDRTSRVMGVGDERRANYLGSCGWPRSSANAHAAKPERHRDGSHSKERENEPHREGHGRGCCNDRRNYPVRRNRLSRRPTAVRTNGTILALRSRSPPWPARRLRDFRFPGRQIAAPPADDRVAGPRDRPDFRDEMDAALF